MPDTDSTPPEISVGQLHEKMQQNDGSWVLVDCRERDEAELASIANSLLLPMSDWAAAFASVESELANKQIIVHCHHGGRSMRVLRWLRQNGYPNAQSLAGGIDAWSLEIDPTVGRY